MKTIFFKRAAHRARAELIRAALPRPSPRVLAIDEAAFKKGQDYNTILSDLLHRYVLETLRGRDGGWLAVFLLTLDDDVKKGIRAVVMDLWEPYHKVVAALLPDAARVADKFHIIRHANRALDDARRRNQGRGRKTGSNRVLFSCRFALLRAVERSRPGDDERRARVFAIAPELETAWALRSSCARSTTGAAGELEALHCGAGIATSTPPASPSSSSSPR